MTFLAQPFPEDISFGAVGGPGFQTDIVIVNSGDEFRNRNWSQARARYEATYGVKTPGHASKIIAHFRNAHGMADSFPFKDWQDYQHNDAGGTPVFTLLTATTFQLTKRYTSGAATVDRYIYLPRSATIVVTGGSGASVNYATGVVTVSSGTPTSWTGEFYVPCRYDSDTLRGQIIDKSTSRGLISSFESIPIVETRDYQ
jgi:uncharacterized protein (TIGR02217 family)